MTHSGQPVVAGLAVGVAFVVIISMNLRLDNTLSDDELIAKYSNLPEIRYFLEKHPDAEANVERLPSEHALIVSFSVEKQVDPASDLYTGINVLRVTAYNQKLTQVTLSVECGVNQGITVSYNFGDIAALDKAEEWCFQTSVRNAGIFEPDTSGDELNDAVYQFAFKP